MTSEDLLIHLTAAALSGLLVNERYVVGMDEKRKEEQIAAQAVSYALAARSAILRNTYK